MRNSGVETYVDGKADFSILSPIERIIVRMVKARDLDRHDWDAIRRWRRQCRSAEDAGAPRSVRQAIAPW